MARWSWSAAVRRGNLLNLEAFTESIKGAGAAGAHVDIGDGRFFPGFGIGTDVAAEIAGATTLPVELHVQVQDADRLVQTFLEVGCASITLPVECLIHGHRAFTLIREAGIEAGVAIGPATPLTALEYLLPSVDRVLLVTRDQNGDSGPLPPSAFERVKIVRENVNYHKHRVAIAIEGATESRDIAQLISHGADHVVVGDPKLLRGDDPTAALNDFVEEVNAYTYVA